MADGLQHFAMLIMQCYSLLCKLKVIMHQSTRSSKSVSLCHAGAQGAIAMQAQHLPSQQIEKHLPPGQQASSATADDLQCSNSGVQLGSNTAPDADSSHGHAQCWSEQGPHQEARQAIVLGCMGLLKPRLLQPVLMNYMSVAGSALLTCPCDQS